MAIRIFSDAKHQPLPVGADGKRIATSGVALLAMTVVDGSLFRCFARCSHWKLVRGGGYSYVSSASADASRLPVGVEPKRLP